MTTYRATLGGTPVTVHVGEGRPPAGELLGLDCETTFLTPLGQWDPAFRVRLVQFATADAAWVYRIRGQVEREAATAVLADPAQTFCSHNNVDVLSAARGLGVDITARNLDTLTLARMAYPDREQDRDLKALATEHIGPELAEADAVRVARFAELWAAEGAHLAGAFLAELAEQAPGASAALTEEWAKWRRRRSATEPDLPVPPERFAELDWTDTKQRAKTRALVRKALPGLPPPVLAAWEALSGWKSNPAAHVRDAFGWATVPADDPAYVVYAGMDAIACRRLAPILTAATQAPPTLLRTEVWLAGRANRIQLRGMRVDGEALSATLAETAATAQHCEDAVLELTGGVKAKSPALHGWLAGQGVDWGTWPGTLTPKGVPSLAKDNVHHLARYPLTSAGTAVSEALTALQEVAYLLTKLREIEARVDSSGRVHPTLNTLGASTTARMSSSGPNFQNFGKADPRMRGLFLPEPGHIFATIDFDQVELRVVAALAREEKMIATILAGGDLHALTVAELASAGVTITRDTAKIVNFLIVYGGGAGALHEQTGIPREAATTIVRAWRDRYRSINALAEYLGMERDALRTVSGRRLPVTRNRVTGELRTYANINYAVQSAARDLLVDAWLRYDREFRRGDTVWFPVHDELVLQVPEGQVAEVMADAETAMAMDFRGVPITATAVELRDEQGVSRWMTAKHSEAIREGKAA